jgi:hypothetical protein
MAAFKVSKPFLKKPSSEYQSCRSHYPLQLFQIFGVNLGQTRLHRSVSLLNAMSRRSCPPARAARRTAALASGLRAGRGRAPFQGIVRTEAALEVCAAMWNSLVRR